MARPRRARSAELTLATQETPKVRGEPRELWPMGGLTRVLGRARSAGSWPGVAQGRTSALRQPCLRGSLADLKQGHEVDRPSRGRGRVDRAGVPDHLRERILIQLSRVGEEGPWWATQWVGEVGKKQECGVDGNLPHTTDVGTERVTSVRTEAAAGPLAATGSWLQTPATCLEPLVALLVAPPPTRPKERANCCAVGLGWRRLETSRAVAVQHRGQSPAKLDARLLD